MKISKYTIICFVLLSFVVLFTFGCSAKDTIDNDPTFEGYILDVDSGTVLVAYDITEEKYIQIKDQPLEEISDNEEYIPLIYLSYNDTNNLKVGHKVNVWINGGINDSYPQQAGAKRIEIINWYFFFNKRRR